MALFNYASKEITLKVVYYGPGLSGKTTNIQYLHENINPQNKGKLLSLATEADRTLFFDFLPVDLGSVKGFRVKFQLYTVPGQVRYNATRRLVLKGADAVVFVADSQADMREQNIQSFENMKENLRANGLDPDTIPLVLQWNKRDLPNVLSPEELGRDLNEREVSTFEAVAVDGRGVQDTFKEITRMLVRDVVRKYQTDLEPSTEAAPAQGAPTPARPKRQIRDRRTGGAQQPYSAGEAYMPGGGQMFDAESFKPGEGEEGSVDAMEAVALEEEIDIDETTGTGEEALEADLEEAEELVPVEEIEEEDGVGTGRSEEQSSPENRTRRERPEDRDLYAVPPRPSALEPGFSGEETVEETKETMSIAAAVSAEMEDLRRQNDEILATLKDIRALLRGSRKKWVRISLK